MLKEHAFNILRVAYSDGLRHALTLLLFSPDYQLRAEKVWSPCDAFNMQKAGKNPTEQ